MRKENTMTVGQWCGQWFTANRHKWNGNTEGGYRNLIYSHILPCIGNVKPFRPEGRKELNEKIQIQFF